MPRVQHIPAAGSWSFPPQSAPATFTLPANADGGTLFLQATTPGSTPVDGDGVIFTVVIDGGAPYNSPCMEEGVDTVIIPPLSTTIEVTVVNGCNAGPSPTGTTVWAVSDP